ncbi:uncharacterized protein LOC114322487 [Camellia sinensis]|uniref:uncharacterized protein LOC114322487 n=1 Tax=Camellia sinensis TaxID=4442 RepID=UPI001036EE12|nr:uncharacterized protein LOC114322487 [Camellia sinensis]
MEVKQAICNHFQKQFTEPWKCRPSIGGSFMRIESNQVQDDTTIFCEADWTEIVAVKEILRCFEVVSGLKINFHKSVNCGVGVEDGSVADFATKLLESKTTSEVSCLPLEANPGRMQPRKPIVEKFKKKLTGWKRRMLSFAGRVTLIKSVLSCLPIYYMSLFRIPKCVAREIDKIQAAFLWGDE